MSENHIFVSINKKGVWNLDTIDKINHLLVDRGMTGAELCRRAGLSNGTYSMWNTRQRNISRSNIAKVAKALGVEPADLLPDGEAPAPKPGLDPELEEILESIRTNPAQRILFKRTKDATPEQLLAIAQMVTTFKQNGG